MSSSPSDFDSDVDFSDDSDLDISEGAGVAKISSGAQVDKPAEPKQLEIPVKAEPIITQIVEEIKRILPPKPQKPKTAKAKARRSLSLSRIPLLNKETINKDTYDIEKLLNPKVQKAALQTLGLEKQISLPKSFNLNLENETKPTPKVTDVANRLLENWEKVKAKKLANRAQSDQKEMEQCPFKPKINNTEAKNRSHDEFYEDMKKYLDEKLKKIKNKQDENEELIRTKSLELPFTPLLCAYSLKIESAKAENTMPRHERLYQLHKSKDNQSLQSILRDKSFASTQMTQSTDDSQVLFHPTVNKRSKELVRDSSVENILYQDALRRHHKSVDAPAPRVPDKVICSNSEKVLIEKLKNEFEDEWNLVDIDDTNIVTYSRMLEILRSMYFLLNPKKQEEARLLTLDLWKILESSYTPVNKESLVVALIAIMGFYQEWMNDEEKFPNRLNLSKEQAKKLHFRNSLLYENRLSVVNKSTINKTYRENYDFSFKPQICAQSERLVTSSVDKKPRNSDSLAVELYRERVKLQQKQDALKQKFSELELKDCTFAPRVKELPKSYQQAKITDKETLSKDYKNLISSAPTKVERTAALFSLASLEKNRKENNYKPYEEQEEEKNKEDLTFKPKLYQREKIDEDKEKHAGVQETVERIVKARRDREIVKAWREKGWTRSPESRQAEAKEETRGRNPLRPPQKVPDKSVKDKETKKIPKEEKAKKIPIKRPFPKPQNKLPLSKAKEEKPKPVAKPIESLENSKDSIDSHNSISTASSEIHAECLNNSGSSLENGKFISNEVIYEDEEMENTSEEGDLHQESTENQDQEGIESEESSYSDEDENTFNIEINLGNGKTEYLAITKGVDPEDSVREFSAKHGITGEAEAKILQLVKNLPSES
ncbi:unnamed protein product [Blepharisma stoltei]|uniref:Uncharacterized protein n=1 Tax=Blepharisma stoltei TaxID=1481888 RepID=A0AAU9K7U1_9CILI|nr:unnamed protein product [Blepharisma stoltei]